MAARKVEGLLAAGAKIKVISPELTLELQLLVDSGKIAYLPRPYQEGDLRVHFWSSLPPTIRL